jgi:hypothetical protein
MPARRYATMVSPRPPSRFKVWRYAYSCATQSIGDVGFRLGPPNACYGERAGLFGTASARLRRIVSRQPFLGSLAGESWSFAPNDSFSEAQHVPNCGALW